MIHPLLFQHRDQAVEFCRVRCEEKVLLTVKGAQLHGYKMGVNNDDLPCILSGKLNGRAHPGEIFMPEDHRFNNGVECKTTADSHDAQDDDKFLISVRYHEFPLG